jgi:uncharacterized SAM-binding protein YcdF (DUF218 family)
VKILIRLLVVAIGLAIVLPLVQHSGGFLVVQRLNKADVIVVLGGDLNDRRYWKGIELLQSGYGRELLVDALDQTTIFGHTYADWARRFVAETNSRQLEKVKVCPIGEDSTVGETKYVQACLADANAKSVLLVTSDFHSRRALSTFSSRLPMYGWYVAVASDPAQFNTHWWLQRKWAKTACEEWQKFLWWELVERWL